MFNSVETPPNKGGRPRSITLVILEALCVYLLENPDLYLDEMAVFYGTSSTSTPRNLVSVAFLHSKDGRRKAAWLKAKERNLALRDNYFHFI